LRFYFTGAVSPEDSKKGEGTSEPFLDFAEEVTESIKDLDINGKIPPLEKKPIPKNGKLIRRIGAACLQMSKIFQENQT
jgi:hypothetical protein